MKIYESNFLTLNYSEEKQLIEVIWHSSTAQMTDDEFKHEMKLYATHAEQNKPKFSLVDTSQFLMTVVPETQAWVNEHIHQRSLSAGIQKFAYLMSKDIFSQVSIEQTMEEGNAQELFETAYFDDKEKALKWLVEK